MEDSRQDSPWLSLREQRAKVTRSSEKYSDRLFFVRTHFNPDQGRGKPLDLYKNVLMHYSRDAFPGKVKALPIVL